MTQNLQKRLAKAELEMLREILREAESYLGAQLTVALASNQRAMTLISLMGAATVVVGGAAGSLLFGDSAHTALGMICASVAAGFLVAMAFAIRVAKPTGFWYVGNNPKHWVGDIEQGRTLQDALAAQCAHYSELIDNNAKILEKDGTRLRIALRLVQATLIMAMVVTALLLARKHSWLSG